MYRWTSTSLNLWFNKNYNSWNDYVVLASLQSGHPQESIMVFDMFGVKFQYSLTSIVKDLTLQAIVGSRNVQINYGKMLDLHDLLFQDLTQLVPFFFLDQKIMIENQNLEMWNVRFKNVKKTEKEKKSETNDNKKITNVKIWKKEEWIENFF